MSNPWFCRFASILVASLLWAGCAEESTGGGELEITALSGKSDVTSSGLVGLDENTTRVSTSVTCDDGPGCHFVVYVPIEETGLNFGELNEHQVGTVSVSTGFSGERVVLPLLVEVAEVHGGDDPQTEYGPHPLYHGAAYINYRVPGIHREIRVEIDKDPSAPELLATIRIDFEPGCESLYECRNGELCLGSVCRPECAPEDMSCEPQSYMRSEPMCVDGACHDRPECGADVSCVPGEHCDTALGRCLITDLPK